MKEYILRTTGGEAACFLSKEHADRLKQIVNGKYIEKTFFQTGKQTVFVFKVNMVWKLVIGIEIPIYKEYYIQEVQESDL